MVNGFDPSRASGLDPRTAGLVERRARVMGPAYRLFYEEPVALVRGLGAHLYDADGNEYLDAYNNVPSVGHSHPRVQEAVSRQLGILNTHTRYLTEPVIEYSERLTALFPPALSQVTYACSGSEAVDFAVRIARHRTGKEGVIVTSNAYHGTTALAAGLSPSLGPNNPLGPGVVTVPAPDTFRTPAEDVAPRLLADIARAIEELEASGVGFAGLLVDSVLSSDGLQLEPAGFLAAAAGLTREAGGLYIADEVQPGFGRTGAGWWGFERHGIIPDIVVLGKPMGNGLPISAVVARPEVQAAFGRDVRYFNTFGGNPVCIAAAGAVLDVIEEEGLMANSAAVGRLLYDGLGEIAARHPVLGHVRGAGLFLAADVVDPADGVTADPALAADLVNRLRRKRILISASGPSGSVLKIRPPLVFSPDDARRLLGTLAETLDEATR